MQKLIVEFNDPEAISSSVTGGKGSALAKLFQAGFNVPNGFVVTSDVIKNDNNQEIKKLLTKIGGKYFAVRSSAAGEDGGKYSWAGQFETFLNVPSKEVLSKISLCFQSAQSEQVKAYNQQANQEINMSVVVQKMVQSEVSGVAFSVNPVSGDANEILIESTTGLGESLVQGEVIPVQFLVNKVTKEVTSISQEDKNQLRLTVKLLKELITEIIKIEQYLGYPCDIEWAVENDRLFILQARPITTL